MRSECIPAGMADGSCEKDFRPQTIQTILPIDGCGWPSSRIRLSDIPAAARGRRATATCQLLARETGGEWSRSHSPHSDCLGYSKPLH
jgi:hypothetical protein